MSDPVTTCRICDGQGVIESLYEAGDEVTCGNCGGTGEAREPDFVPGSLMANPEFREIHSMFQRLWTKAVGQEGYDKKEWQRMDNALARLARKAGL